MLEFKKTNQLSEDQELQIYELWNKEFTAKISYNDISEFEAYLDKLVEQHHILVLDEYENVLGWFFDFIRDEERWFAIIIDSSLHGKGVGSKILDLAKSSNKVLNAWVTDHNTDLKRNGEPYQSPLQFYIKNDFEVLTDVRIETEILSAVKIRWSKTN